MRIPRSFWVHPWASLNSRSQVPGAIRASISLCRSVENQSTSSSSFSEGVQGRSCERTSARSLEGISDQTLISIRCRLVAACVVDLDDKRRPFTTPAGNPLVVVRKMAVVAILELAIVPPFVGAGRPLNAQSLHQDPKTFLHVGWHPCHILQDTFPKLNAPSHNIPHFGVSSKSVFDSLGRN